MPTKSNRATIKDIKQGKTLWNFSVWQSCIPGTLMPANGAYAEFRSFRLLGKPTIENSGDITME